MDTKSEFHLASRGFVADSWSRKTSEGNMYHLTLVIGNNLFINDEFAKKFYKEVKNLTQKYLPESEFSFYKDERDGYHSELTFLDGIHRIHKFNLLLNKMNGSLGNYVRGGSVNLDSLVRVVENKYLQGNNRSREMTEEEILDEEATYYIDATEREPINKFFRYMSRLFDLGDSLIDAFDKQDDTRTRYIIRRMDEEKEGNQSFVNYNIKRTIRRPK